MIYMAGRVRGFLHFVKPGWSEESGWREAGIYFCLSIHFSSAGVKMLIVVDLACYFLPLSSLNGGTYILQQNMYLSGDDYDRKRSARFWDVGRLL